jgi:hypothetical protein
MLLNRSVDLGCSAHALEIDLNGRLHDPHPSVEGDFAALQAALLAIFPFWASPSYLQFHPWQSA